MRRTAFVLPPPAAWLEARALRVPIGVAIVGQDKDACLVGVDPDGVLVVVSFGPRKELVKVAFARYWRVYASLGRLVHALRAELAIGFVPELLPLNLALFRYEGEPVPA